MFWLNQSINLWLKLKGFFSFDKLLDLLKNYDVVMIDIKVNLNLYVRTL